MKDMCHAFETFAQSKYRVPLSCGLWTEIGLMSRLQRTKCYEESSVEDANLIAEIGENLRQDIEKNPNAHHLQHLKEKFLARYVINWTMHIKQSAQDTKIVSGLC